MIITIGSVIRTPALLEEVRACAARLQAHTAFECSEAPALLGRADPIRADAVLIEASELDRAGAGLIEEIKNRLGGPMVIALHTTADAERILSAVRAGAEEFLYPPFYDSLRAALERCAQRRVKDSAGAPAGKLVSFLSAKGGCGASTIACNVAALLARHTKEKVLLADFDLNCGIVRFLMGSKCDYSVADAFDNVHRLDPSYWGGLVSNGIPGLDIISGPQHLRLAPDPPAERIAQVLVFAASHYAWTVVDLGRGLNSFASTVLANADQSYLVSTLDIAALYHSKAIIRVLADEGYDRKRLRLICNAAPHDGPITAGDLEKFVGLPADRFLPQAQGAAEECLQLCKLLPDASALGKELAALTRSIAGISEPSARGRQGALSWLF